VDDLPRARLLVVGDLMLDRYVRGATERISAEAPVPIVRIQSEEERLGGAANVLRNARALGATVFPLGVVGDDPPGRRLLEHLRSASISTDTVLRSSTRQTTQKIRVISHSQQMIRLDREDTSELSADEESELLRRLHALGDAFDAVIVEDYAKGVVTRTVMEALLERCRRPGHSIPILVDPTATRMDRYRGVDYITPNHHEAARATGREVRSDADLDAVVAILMEQLAPRGMLVTRGEHGMSLYLRGERPHHIPTRAQEVFDVSGAGDTVAAVMGLAIARGATPLDAAHLANYAAGVVVGKFGTATVSRDELKASCDQHAA